MRIQRPILKSLAGIIVLVSLVCIFLNSSSVYLPSTVACSLFSSSGCATFKQYPYVPSRKLNDDEIGARVVFEEILKTPPIQSKNRKIAFMFLTPGSLPFEKLWDKFFNVRLCSFLIISLLFVLLLALFMRAYSSWIGVFKFYGMLLYLCLWFCPICYGVSVWLLTLKYSIFKFLLDPYWYAPGAMFLLLTWGVGPHVRGGSIAPALSKTSTFFMYKCKYFIF